jgi:predicted ATPase/class 3 adenylate cyclase
VTQLPTGTVTFLFTDLEGSTRRWEDDPTAMRAALARHDEILRDAIGEHDGVIVKTTGDGVHAAFAGAHAAVATAAAAQRALHDEAWTGPTPLRVRMGLHTGEAELRDGDYYGPALNRAARLMSAAHGGQIVISHATEELLRDDLPPGLDLVDLGEHQLRDLNRRERVFQVTVVGLPETFPELQSVGAPRGNAVPAITALVGREDDVQSVEAALTRVRVVTVTGAGGVGKTRLANEVAWRVHTEFPDGAWLCELAAAREPSAVAEVVAATLSVTSRPGMSVSESVVDYLRTKSMLLVVDNCEHQLDAVWELVGAITRGAPAVRVLTTSREGLGVDGEQIVPLRSLPVPSESADDDAIIRSDAVRLFVERATAADPGFAVASSAQAVAEICRRLDGIPLAIELAAARTVAMRPTEIAAVLDERFRLLTGGRRTTVQRHQTLRATVDWSYALLTETERAVFDRLGVFSGTFDLDAVEAVVVGDDLTAWDARDAVAGLVSKSMLVIDEGDAETTRYRLLETLREYAADRLDEDDAGDHWRRRHAAYYAERAASIGVGMEGPDEFAWRARMRGDSDNIRAAVTWSLDAREPTDHEYAVAIVAAFAYESNGGIELPVSEWALRALDAAEASTPGRRFSVLGAATWGEVTNGNFDRARELASAALRDGIPRDAQAPALAHQALSIIDFISGDYPSAVARTARAQVELDELGIEDPFGRAILATTAVAWMTIQRDTEEFRAAADAALELARASGCPSSISIATFTKTVGVWRDDPTRAGQILDEAIAIMRRGASAVVGGYMLAIRAQIWSVLGDDVRALRTLRESITTSQDKGDASMLVTCVAYAIQIMARAGRADGSALAAGAAIDGPAAFFGTLPAHEQTDHEWAQARARELLGPERYDARRAEGAAMPVADVAAQLLRAIDDAIDEIRDRAS